MDREIIMSKLDSKDHESLRNTLCFILNTYCTPSFGSMSKHDIDLLLFESLLTLGIINNNPTIYNVMRDLRVTRTKARNLIYEYQLRIIQNEDQLKSQLYTILKNPIISCESNNVWLEIDNPYLIDYIRNELKLMGFVTDGSFHAELVKISTDAFSVLYEKMLPEKDKKELRNDLVKYGVKPDLSLKAIFPKLIKEVSKKLGKAAMGKNGEDIAGECIKYLGDNLVELKGKYGDLFS